MDEQLPAATRPPSHGEPSPIKVKKIGHLVYEVSDIERTIKFWTDVMGFSVADKSERGMVFLRCAADHHAIGLVQSKARRKAAGSAGLGIHHLAFEVENVDMLFKARDWLENHGIPVVYEGRRGPGCNVCIHVDDPDGFNFELYCDMDQIGEGQMPRPTEQFHPVGSLEAAVANPIPKDW